MSNSWCVRVLTSLAICASLVSVSSPSHARKLKKKDKQGIIAGFAVAGGSIALGAVFAALSASWSAEADDLGATLRAQNHAQPCTAEPQSCEEIDSLLHRRDDYGDGAVIAFSTGGGLAVLMAVAVISIITDRRGEAPSEHAPTVVATPHGPAMQVAW